MSGQQGWMANKSGYPGDMADEERALVMPYLLLCREDIAQYDYAFRTVFNGWFNCESQPALSNHTSRFAWNPPWR